MSISNDTQEPSWFAPSMERVLIKFFKEKSAIQNYIHSPQYEKDCMSEQKFIKHIKMERNNFYKKKEAGIFDNGMHPATKGTKRVKYNKFFNYTTDKIELPTIYIIQFQA